MLKHQNFSIIIQARHNSTRYKAKILEKINNKEILLIMVKRLEKYKKNIIINISNNNPSKIIKFCKDNELNYFVGSDHNVLKRYYDCAAHYKSKNIVRIPLTAQFIDVKILEKGLNLFFKGNYTYVTNLCPPSYIDGNDIEIMSFNILKKLYQNAKNKFDKEHVTTDLRRNINRYKFKNFLLKKLFIRI